MPEEELNIKIRNELLKSGFPLEIRCRQLMSRHGWIVSDDRIYLGPDGIEHEIDAIGTHSLIDIDKMCTEDESSPLEWDPFTLFSMIVECKKNSSNHWVFFDDGSITTPPLNLLSSLRPFDHLHLERMLDSIWSACPVTDHHYLRTRMVSSYCMAFKAEKNQIYEGLGALLGAYRHERDDDAAQQKKMHEICKEEPQLEESQPWIFVYYPVLVLDGRMFVAELADGELDIHEVQHVIYSAMHPSYCKTRVTVDVVRADLFDSLLIYLAQDMTMIEGYIQDKKYLLHPKQ